MAKKKIPRYTPVYTPERQKEDSKLFLEAVAQLNGIPNNTAQDQHNAKDSDVEQHAPSHTTIEEERALFLQYMQCTDCVLEEYSSHTRYPVYSATTHHNDVISITKTTQEPPLTTQRKHQIHVATAPSHRTTSNAPSNNKVTGYLSKRSQKLIQNNTHTQETRQSFHTKLVEHPKFFVKSFRYDIPHYVKEQLETLHTSAQQIRNTIDLHKMTLLSAYTTVIQFIQQNYCCNAHICCIITGKGRHSLYNKSFLRQALIEWLLSYPISEVLYGFISPAKSNGGEGAIALFLQPYNPQLRIQWHIRSDFCTY